MSGLLCQFKPDRAPGLSLTHSRPIRGVAIGRNIIDFYGDNVAASQLAIDRQIEQRQIACLPSILEHRSDCPNVLRPRASGQRGCGRDLAPPRCAPTRCRRALAPLHVDRASSRGLAMGRLAVAARARDRGKVIGPPLQIGSRNQGLLPDLANSNFAAGNELIEFRATDRCQPAALGNRVEQLIHMALAIIGRDGPGDRTRAFAGDGEPDRRNVEIDHIGENRTVSARISPMSGSADRYLR